MRATRQNARTFERFSLDRGYSKVSVWANGEVVSGHVYDISLNGIQFELDEPIEPGTIS